MRVRICQRGRESKSSMHQELHARAFVSYDNSQFFKARKYNTPGLVHTHRGRRQWPSARCSTCLNGETASATSAHGLLYGRDVVGNAGRSRAPRVQNPSLSPLRAPLLRDNNIETTRGRFCFSLSLLLSISNKKAIAAQSSKGDECHLIYALYAYYCVYTVGEGQWKIIIK